MSTGGLLGLIRHYYTPVPSTRVHQSTIGTNKSSLQGLLGSTKVYQSLPNLIRIRRRPTWVKLGCTRAYLSQLKSIRINRRPTWVKLESSRPTWVKLDSTRAYLGQLKSNRSTRAYCTLVKQSPLGPSGRTWVNQSLSGLPGPT